MEEKREVRVRLGDDDFSKLVHGEEVITFDLKGTKVRMILADIGFDRMLGHVRDAIQKSINREKRA